MNTIRRLLGLRVTPKRIGSDDIYPVHAFDSMDSVRNLVVGWALVFNDVLDPRLLQKSLSELLEIGDWRKLGGRLRLKDDGNLELHVPRPFTDERPAIAFSHSSFPCAIEDHPSGKTLPKPTDHPSLHDEPDFRGFAIGPGTYEKVEDLFYHDTPPLFLHVSSFKNATVVALTYPHLLMDAMGQKAFLQAWCSVLSEKASQLPEMLGAREDAIAAIASDPRTATVAAKGEDFILRQRSLKSWQMFKFGLRSAWDLLWNRNSSFKMCFLPKKAMDTLREQAHNDLASLSANKETPFLSDGDILSAWFAKIIARSLPSPRPISLLQVVNMRFRLSALKNSGVYVQNMLAFAWSTLPTHAQQLSLGQIALQHRKDLTEQSAEQQVLAVLRNSFGVAGRSVDLTKYVCGPSNTVLVPITNWTKADFFNIASFEAAVREVGDASPSRINPPGSIVFQFTFSTRVSPLLRNACVVLGKDLEENYWLQGLSCPSTWETFEDALRELL